MIAYDKSKIARLMAESDAASTADAKGDKLEELGGYLFGTIPGVSFAAKNVLDGKRAHELDLVFVNAPHLSNLVMYDAVLIVECKNYASPVGSKEVGWFLKKLHDRGCGSGVLLSLSGITGHKDGESNAHDEIRQAMAVYKTRLVVISREENNSLKTSEDLVDLLRTKFLDLIMRRIISLKM